MSADAHPTIREQRLRLIELGFFSINHHDDLVLCPQCCAAIPLDDSHLGTRLAKWVEQHVQWHTKQADYDHWVAEQFRAASNTSEIEEAQW